MQTHRCRHPRRDEQRGGRRVTADGLEHTFALNHFAPFLLTNLLLDRLEPSAAARIVTVSSALIRLAASTSTMCRLSRSTLASRLTTPPSWPT